MIIIQSFFWWTCSIVYTDVKGAFNVKLFLLRDESVNEMNGEVPGYHGDDLVILDQMDSVRN